MPDPVRLQFPFSENRLIKNGRRKFFLRLVYFRKAVAFCMQKNRRRREGNGGTALTLIGDYQKDNTLLSQKLRVSESFDVVCRELEGPAGRLSFYFVDGFVKDEVMEKIMEFLLKAKKEEYCGNAQTFLRRMIPYVEASLEQRVPAVVTAVLSGQLALIVQGITGALLLDVRTYPARGPEEPEDDRVLRGSRDGFTETLVFNTALIRRRIRDPALTMRQFSVGRRSKTDVVLCYMDGTADPKLLQSLCDRISTLRVDALNMGQESLMEALLTGHWLNPFPRVRYTERPDAASACLLEGRILMLVDNSPAAAILPTCLLDFLQETDDYCFPPLTGTYLRLTRTVIFLLTLLMTPTWYLLITHPQWIPERWAFLQISEPNTVPILLQLFIVEFAVDGLKLASLNTPGMLSGSFSVVSALILGDFAVKTGWFVPEVILYMAFVSIANFTQPSFELGYAFKFLRMMILLLTGIFGLWGYIGGIVLTVWLAASTKTISGKSYLYPAIPFNEKSLKALLIRKPLEKK